MSNFISYTYWLNEKSNEKITVLLPGSFKPMHIGHVDLVKRYAKHPDVKEVKVLIGPGIRNGINQKSSLEIAEELLGAFKNVSVEAAKYPSPILTAYKYIETAKPGTYAMAGSNKDLGSRGYQRVLDFVKGYNKGGKYYNLKPEDVKVVELGVNVEPILYSGRSDDKNGEPISGRILRQDVLNDDYENFQTNYPGYNDYTIKKIWTTLKGIVTEELHEKFEEKTDPVKDMGIGAQELNFKEKRNEIMPYTNPKTMETWLYFMISLKGKKIVGDFEILDKSRLFDAKDLEKIKNLTLIIDDAKSYMNAKYIVIVDKKTGKEYRIIPEETYLLYR